MGIRTISPASWGTEVVVKAHPVLFFGVQGFDQADDFDMDLLVQVGAIGQDDRLRAQFPEHHSGGVLAHGHLDGETAVVLFWRRGRPAAIDQAGMLLEVGLEERSGGRGAQELGLLEGLINQQNFGLGPSVALDVADHIAHTVVNYFLHVGTESVVVRRAQGTVLGDDMGVEYLPGSGRQAVLETGLGQGASVDGAQRHESYRRQDSEAGNDQQRPG